MTAPDSLAAALAALQAQLPRVTKDATNPHFKSKYATLDAITAALFPIMAKLGLSFIAKPTYWCPPDEKPRFALHYTLWHVSGDNETGWYPLPETGNPQQAGSAITYARRYALCAVTGLAPDDDDDGNEASGPPPRPRASQLTPAQQKAARTADPGRGKTPTDQRDDRKRRIAEERAVAQAKAPDRPMDRGPLPDADNVWQEREPEDRPGTVSPGQKRAIEALLTKLGCATGAAQEARDERHAVVLKYLPEVEALDSMNKLSYNEAATVIRGLSADTGDAKMPQTVPDRAQRAANDWPEDWPS